MSGEVLVGQEGFSVFLLDERALERRASGARAVLFVLALLAATVVLLPFVLITGLVWAAYLGEGGIPWLRVRVDQRGLLFDRVWLDGRVLPSSAEARSALADLAPSVGCEQVPFASVLEIVDDEDGVVFVLEDGRTRRIPRLELAILEEIRGVVRRVHDGLSASRVESDARRTRLEGLVSARF